MPEENSVISAEQFGNLMENLFSEPSNPEPANPKQGGTPPQNNRGQEGQPLPEFNYQEFLAGEGNPFETSSPKEEGTSEEQEPKEATPEEEVVTEGKIAFEVDGQEYSYDLENPEEFDKLVTDAKNWKENEKTVTELVNQKKELDVSRDSFISAVKLLHGQRNFDLMNNPEDFLEEQPFDYYLDLADQNKDKARQLQKAHKQELVRAEDFRKNFEASQKKFLSIQSEFKKNHPEIQDVDKWVKENLTPYSNFIATYGEAEPQADMLEMIYFWKNKDAFIKELKNKVAKEIASRKTTPPQSGGQPAVTPSINRRAKSEGENMIDEVLKSFAKRFEGDQVLTRFRG